MTDFEKYREEKLNDPEFKVKYLFAQEKLNLELMIDSIEEAVEKKSPVSTVKRRTNKLRKHILSLVTM